MKTLTIISVVVGLASLVVGVIQLFLMLTQTHKDKKKSPLVMHQTGDFSKSMVKGRLTASGSLLLYNQIVTI